VFDHVAIRASDEAASALFYRTVLGPLGIEPDTENERMVRWQEFIVSAGREDRPPTRNVHIGFGAPARELVDAFWRAGTDAGHPGDGAPGERSQYSEDYYGAFLRDPDGNSAEAAYHNDTRHGGRIDHLWVGVRDLPAAEAFYETISRYAGLRHGRRWEHGFQFRGAWATFSLVADGRPPTENLHLAFPAPDRETVDEFHAKAVAAGYESNGEPGERPQYHPGYYAAFVLDPDGNNIESVFHGQPEAA
jgi:catechol 2,3-dioxygenase-like lactoylglutathione lyase family enzyme